MLQNTSHRPWYGTPVDPTITIWMIKFNDIPALEEALEPGDIACVLAEPAWTNIGIVLPEPGYHKALREITSRTGTLIIVDETHTISAGPGGYTMSHDLQPDMFTLGKPIGSGIPAAIYGLTDQVAIRIKAALQKDGGTIHGIGGKLAGNALSCSHESNFPACADKRGLWTHHPVSKTLCRRGWIGHWGVQVTLEYCAVGVPSWILVPGHTPRNGSEAFASEDLELARYMHLATLNRGILLTPFHNMALIATDHAESDIDLHTNIFRDIVRGLVDSWKYFQFPSVFEAIYSQKPFDGDIERLYWNWIHR